MQLWRIDSKNAKISQSIPKKKVAAVNECIIQQFRWILLGKKKRRWEMKQLGHWQTSPFSEEVRFFFTLNSSHKINLSLTDAYHENQAVKVTKKLGQKYKRWQNWFFKLSRVDNWSIKMTFNNQLKRENTKKRCSACCSTNKKTFNQIGTFKVVVRSVLDFFLLDHLFGQKASLF